MLARDHLRSNNDQLRQGLSARGFDLELLDQWIDQDRQRRQLLVQVEEAKQQRNTASKAIGIRKQQGQDADAEIAQVGALKTEISAIEEKLSNLTDILGDAELSFPNLTHDSVPVGVDESDNRVERTVGDLTQLEFEAQAHWDLGTQLGILDFERAAKISGARFVVYMGAGALLERALIQFMLDVQTREHGYTEVIPPFMVNSKALVGTGQLPKFGEDLFHIDGGRFHLVPTAEVPLTNLHAREVLNHADLPIRYTAYTPCFRAEAGSYGKDVRGLIRLHQFNKVELVAITDADSSYAMHETLTSHAESILQRLDLPYRVVTLSTGDTGFSAAKTYDLEVWLPGQNAYREISSCSNCEAFQARRAGIRYRDPNGSNRYAHTLNGSGLAVGRTVVGILENYQQADGSIAVPKVLQPYMGGLEKITGR